MEKNRSHTVGLLKLFGAAVACCMLAACSNQQSTPPFYTPATLVSSNSRSLAVLADGSENLYIPRGEKGVESSIPLSQISAYSDYTYDSQRIGTPNNTGYRNRYVVRQGVTVP